MNKVIIFDFDGVLVDTEYTTFTLYKNVLPTYNIHLQESDFKYKIGRKSIDFFTDVLKDKFDPELVNTLVEMKRNAFLHDIRKYLVPIPGAFELVKACYDAGLVIALGSQNEKPLINKALDEFNLRKYFTVVTSLQDIKKKKPDPEILLLVTNALHISPQEAVVIEDSPHGIEAAQKIGMKSVGITTSFTRKELQHATKIIKNMSELTPELLSSM